MKPVKSVVTAFYQGGTKVQMKLAQTRLEVESEMERARKEMRDAKLEEVNDNPEVEDSYIFFTRNNLMFYNVMTPKEKTLVEVITPKLVTG